jgi:hypothetical protein
VRNSAQSESFFAQKKCRCCTDTTARRKARLYLAANCTDGIFRTNEVVTFDHFGAGTRQLGAAGRLGDPALHESSRSSGSVQLDGRPCRRRLGTTDFTDPEITSGFPGVVLTTIANQGNSIHLDSNTGAIGGAQAGCDYQFSTTGLSV